MNIKEFRVRNNLSQSELAEKLKVTQGLISQWENNETLPKVSALVQMADLFNCSVDDLVKEG